MGDERDARGDQLGSRRLDDDVAVAVGTREADRVVRARHLAVLELGLRDRGAEVDVPERRRLGLVRLAAGEVAQERALRRRAARRSPIVVYVMRPVDRETERGATAPRTSARPRRRAARTARRSSAARSRSACFGGFGRRRERRVVRQRRVAADAVVVLHPALGGQAVVVPAHRVEDLVAPHAPVAGDGVGVRVDEHGAHVQRPAHRRRRRVDGEDLGAALRPVEPVGAVGLPARRPLLLEPVEASASPARPCGRVYGTDARA